ncbi:unnamed protein product [Amoebophrya sp. A120]|nr:unnamed protein product [Amoebophrya sp. A120]|eukprot:GSA120T00007762001.1
MVLQLKRSRSCHWPCTKSLFDPVCRHLWSFISNSKIDRANSPKNYLEKTMTDTTDDGAAARHPKRFVNEDASRLVRDAIDGLVAINAKHLTRFQYQDGTKVILRKDWTKQKVALISGGGAGHEPAHAGFVGQGMLTAAVSGEVFASPTVDAILAAIVAVTGPKGCLLIVKNYTGDRLNFGLAAERAKSEYGLRVRMVIVADDVALLKQASVRQARGLAGTLLVHKTAGAAAEDDAKLDQVTMEAQKMALAVKTFGCSMSTCTQAFSQEGRSLGDNKMEVGLGIHGEPGARKMEVLPVSDIVQLMLDEIMEAIDTQARETLTMAPASQGGAAAPAAAPQLSVSASVNNASLKLNINHPPLHLLSFPDESSEETVEFVQRDHSKPKKEKSHVVVLINNLGSVPALEMQIVGFEVLKNLGRRSIHIVGPAPLMTSLDMNGFSLTMAVVDEFTLTNRLCATKNFAPHLNASWPGVASGGTVYFQELDLPATVRVGTDAPDVDVFTGGEDLIGGENSSTGTALPSGDSEMERQQTAFQAQQKLLSQVCQILIDNKDTLNEMDKRVGDGDTGTQMELGAKAVLDQLVSGSARTKPLSYHALCENLSRILRKNMGGSSGILLSIFFAAMSAEFRNSKLETSAGKITNAASSSTAAPPPSGDVGADCGSQTVNDSDQRNKSFEEAILKAFRKGVQTVSEVGGAVEGDRTMLDALLPASRVGSFEELFPAAKNGAERTRNLLSAQAGRSQYVPAEDLEGNMDPGAFACMLAFQAMQESTL